MGEVVWQGRVQRSRLTGDTASHQFRVWKKKKHLCVFVCSQALGSFIYQHFTEWIDEYIFMAVLSGRLQWDSQQWLCMLAVYESD